MAALMLRPLHKAPRSRRPIGRAGLLVVVGLIILGASGSARASSLGPEIVIAARDDASFPASYDVADQLAPDTVLQMRVTKFKPFTRAVAEQCAPRISRECGNAIPVQFDSNGTAQFQYLVTDDFLVARPVQGGCRANAAPCTIVVRAMHGQRRGEIQTVFVDAIPPPGRIEVTPSRRLSLDGQAVTVQVHDYPPGVTVTAMLCAAPDTSGPRCGSPGPTAPLLVGADGGGQTELVIEPGPVGASRVQCGRGDDCGVSVASADVFARAPVVSISFAPPPGADYDPNRLLIGIGLAVVLIAIATWLIVRGDWSAIGEAAAPEIDDADYADLDAIIAALPPEEEDDIVPTG